MADEIENTQTFTAASRESAGGGLAGVPGMPGMIGQYRVVRVLGEGGMGIVYEAEQQQPRRLVALKVMRAGMTSEQSLRRFELEGEALGRLQHPGIAQIYESGTARSGTGEQPYFAMEFVQGKPLREYAAERGLGLRERLELFAKVCDAVNHAHQRGIVHRDLKPSNILVDATGQPKVLDFGVARVMDSESETTRYTMAGQLVGTLIYMSPEQAKGNLEDLDLRSDVYTLGVVLYELLAGRLPYAVRQTAMAEVVRIICEEDPASISTLDRTYRGDIETILNKALEKDRGQRYASAAEMAADVRRHLADEPILAKAPTAGYQLEKFARRHRGLLGAVAAVFLVLLLGIVVSVQQAGRAREAERAAVAQRDRAVYAEDRAREEASRALTEAEKARKDRDRAVTAEEQAQRERGLAVMEKLRADREAASALAVNGFLERDLLGQADPAQTRQRSAAPDPDLKVRTTLDRAAAQIAGKFEGQPAVEASLRHVIGVTYIGLGLFKDARVHLDRALALRLREFGKEHETTLETQSRMVTVLSAEGKGKEAEELLREILAVRRRVLGPAHRSTLQTMTDMGSFHELAGRYAEGEKLIREALGMQRRLLGAEDRDTLRTQGVLAYSMVRQQKLKEAEAMLQETLTLYRRVLGPDHPWTIRTIRDQATVYLLAGDFKKAEGPATESLEILRRVMGREQQDTLTAWRVVADIYLQQGNYAKAVKEYEAQLEVIRRVRGAEHPLTLTTMGALGSAAYYQMDYVKAEGLLSEVYRLMRKQDGPEHPNTLIAMTILANTYRAMRKLEEAGELHGQVLAIQRRTLRADHPNLFLTMGNLATVFIAQEKFKEAEATLEEALAGQRRVFGQQNNATLFTMHALREVYVQQGKMAEAEALAVETLQGRQRALGAEHPRTKDSQRALASLYARVGKFKEAEAIYVQMLETAKRAGKGSEAEVEAMVSLAYVMAEQGRAAEAEPLARAGLEAASQHRFEGWGLHYIRSVMGLVLTRQGKYEEGEKLLEEGHREMEALVQKTEIRDRYLLGDVTKWVTRMRAERRR